MTPPPVSSTLSTTVVGYLRVSTNEQALSGAGLDAQEAAIRAEADRRGWTLHALHTDAGASGRTLAHRPALAAAIEDIESGAAGGLVVAKLDRLSRSLLDFAGLMERARSKNWNLVALDLGIDLSTPAGEFLASVMASAAQWERRIIGQRTKDALAAKRAAGVRLGRPPSLPDEVEQLIRSRRESGATYQAIADELNKSATPTAQGGLQWHSSTVCSVHRRLAHQLVP
ncbi:resolvase [Nocardioides sp. BGMRC 2183]|nr:resolvase [Nocardioides sp. BGMRC 2183]